MKEIDGDGVGITPSTKEIYVYDELREGRGAAGDHIVLRFSESEDLTGRYMHGPIVDQIFTGESVSNPSIAGDVFWSLTDH